MNKFLNRKKTDAKVETNHAILDSSREGTPSLASPPLKKNQSKWKKNRRQPEPKQEFNLNNILPPADDFRTSLLMPNLSARFSMLREQDDPNSLLGKASDDSVLQPRRRSRMIDFGYASRALGDIAEVSSLRSSVRPPFAETERHTSFISEDGYDSDTNNSSILSRARPGEGNTLFGGRQKVYMIPKSGASSTTKLGKVVYEDDIKTSAFQKHRQREREAAAAKMADEAGQFDFGLDSSDTYAEDDATTAPPHDSHQDLSHSPSVSSYDKKRSTNSSTARSEARSSTAATSVASQPANNPSSAPPSASMQSRPSLDKSHTKARRLYEQGLDQHMFEQQSSAMTRLNSIQRQRTPWGSSRSGSPYLHQAKSYNNLHDGPGGQRSVYAIRNHSPPPDRRITPLKSIGSFRHDVGGDSDMSGPASPLSPQVEGFGETDVLTQALEPGDRGKATAMGAFNKPKQAFDEKQYLERQLALQKSTSSVNIRREASAPAGFQQRIAKYNDLDHEARTSSATSSRSRSDSSPKGQDKVKTSGHSYHGSAAKNPNRSVTPSQLAQLSPQMTAQYPDTHRTFFGDIAASDSEDDEDDRVRHDSAVHSHQDYQYSTSYNKWQPSVLPSVSEHPALRSQRSKAALVEEEEDEILRSMPVPPSQTVQRLAAEKDMGDMDSPTWPPTENLNGLVSHLRSKSNASSVYPGDEVPNTSDAPDLPANARSLHAYGATNPHIKSAIQGDLRVDSSYSGSSPWELDDTVTPYSPFARDNLRGPVSPVEEPAPYNPRIPSMTAAERDLQGQSQISQVSGISQESDSTSWQKELRKQHHIRGTSSATEQERTAFDNELAARRAAIQDNIKSIVETERTNIFNGGAGNALKALGILRTKNSRDSMDPKREPSKLNRMFGINGGSSSGNSPVIPQHPVQREWSESRVRSDELRPTPIQSPPISIDGRAGRSRSNSGTTTTAGRSRSRTGPYRDDLERAMMEGTGSRAAGVPDLAAVLPKELTPKLSTETMQSPFDSTAARARSNSRTNAANGYFDSAAHQSTHGTRSPPAPVTSQQPQLVSAFSPIDATSVRSSPVPSPFGQQVATPPFSGSNTPLNAAFTTSPPVQPSGRPLRKKTISKSDISEPTLISSTSTVDTVDLPAGASLKNGMVEAPPVPPINPKRKTRRLFGRNDQRESVEEVQVDRNARSKTPDPWAALDNNTKVISGNAFAEQHQQQASNPASADSNKQPLRGFGSSPALTQYGYKHGDFVPHERSDTRQASADATVGASMF